MKNRKLRVGKYKRMQAKIFKKRDFVVSDSGIPVYGISTFNDIKPLRVRKYRLRENNKPHGRVINQYKKILKKLNIKEGVVLDFGCCIAHASYTIKAHSDRLLYIGADCSGRHLKAASEDYSPDFLYKVNYKAPCLDAMRENTVDLIIASRLTDWSECDNFIKEFARVLKPGGTLFLWNNKRSVFRKGVFGIEAKKQIFKIFVREFQISKSEASKFLWGNKETFKNAKINTKEKNKALRGSLVKKFK